MTTDYTKVTTPELLTMLMECDTRIDVALEGGGLEGFHIQNELIRRIFNTPTVLVDPPENTEYSEQELQRLYEAFRKATTRRLIHIQQVE